MEVSPPPWNCRNSTFGFSRANMAVTMGTKAEGEDQWRSMVKEWPMMATRRAPSARILGTRAWTSGSANSSRARTRASRMCWFFSPQFQTLRPAICHSAGLVPTGEAQLFPSSSRPTASRSASLPGRPSWPT